MGGRGFNWPGENPAAAAAGLSRADTDPARWGARGDGVFRTIAQARPDLSTLAAAQAEFGHTDPVGDAFYPRVLSLDDGIDSLALQKSLTAAMRSDNREWRPEGHYVLDRPLALWRQDVVVNGGGSVIEAYTAPGKQPCRSPLLWVGPYGVIDGAAITTPLTVPTAAGPAGTTAMVVGGLIYPALGQLPYWVNFGRGMQTLDGRTGFCLELDYYANSTPAPSGQHLIFGAQGSLTGSLVDPEGYCLYLGIINGLAGPEWRFVLNTSNGAADTFANAGTNPAAAGAWKRLTVDFNGSRLKFWVGGLKKADVPCTGTVVQKFWHDFSVGAWVVGYPDSVYSPTTPDGKVANLRLRGNSVYSDASPPTGVPGANAFDPNTDWLWCDFSVRDLPFLQFKTLSGNVNWTWVRCPTVNNDQSNVTVRDLLLRAGSEGVVGDTCVGLTLQNLNGQNLSRSLVYLWNQCYHNAVRDCVGYNGVSTFQFANNSSFAQVENCSAGITQVGVMIQESYGCTIRGGWYNTPFYAGLIACGQDNTTTVVGGQFDDESTFGTGAKAGLWFVNHAQVEVAGARVFMYTQPRPHFLLTNCGGGTISATVFSHASTAQIVERVAGAMDRTKIDCRVQQIQGQAVPLSLSANVRDIQTAVS